MTTAMRPRGLRDGVVRSGFPSRDVASRANVALQLPASTRRGPVA